MNIPAYLDRIGCQARIPLTVEGLQTLTQAHLRTVPFENLALTDEGMEPSLDPEVLFHKVVEQKRGGYCFELNKLFCLLLAGLGFDCRSVAARVINNRPEPCPISHRAVVVTVEGKRYFCDVGFGGAGPKGILPLDDGPEQTVAGEPFHVSAEADGIAVCRYEEGKLWRILKFRDEPWPDVDFDVLNRYYATYHRSPFLQKRILYLTERDGWKSLIHHTFTRSTGGICHVTELEEKDIPRVIREEFGLPFPVNHNQT